MRRSSRKRAAFLLLTLAPNWLGCWSFQTGPKDFEFAEAVSARAEATAILRVNEAGIPWGNGEFGSAIQEQLLSRGIFSKVYYPVEPIDPPGTVVEVVGLGDFDEAVLWAMIAAAATGYFLFLPAPVMPYFQSYEAEFEVRVVRAGEQAQTFQVASSASIVHAAFAAPSSYLPGARTSLIENLSKQVAAGVEALGPY
jgi:hypothetical protein